MIPKIIHYVWIDNNPYPDKIKECVDSWHRYLPEYEFILWDRKKILEINQPFPTQAIEMKKWAFAADFTRLYALNKYGGIYLDTDVQVFKSFNSLLNYDCFIGREKWLHIHNDKIEYYLTSHCFGAIPNHPFIKRCLDYYWNRNFILSDDKTLPEHLRVDLTIIPYILSEFAKEFGYISVPSHAKKQELKNNIGVFPYNFFDCNEITNETYCKHFCMGSWRNKELYSKPESKTSLNYKLKYNVNRYLRKIANHYNYLLIKKP